DRPTVHFARRVIIGCLDGARGCARWELVRLCRGSPAHHNAASEGFFARLNYGMFYRRNRFDTMLEQFMRQLDSYIRWSASNQGLSRCPEPHVASAAPESRSANQSQNASTLIRRRN